MCAEAFVEGSAIHVNVAGVTVFQWQNIYMNIKNISVVPLFSVRGTLGDYFDTEPYIRLFEPPENFDFEGRKIHQH